MPLHLESVVNSNNDDVFNWILQEPINQCDNFYGDNAKNYLISSKNIIDINSGMKTGEYVFTFKINIHNKTLDLLDADIILTNPCNAEVKFIKRLKNSSEANEYYDAEASNGGMFQLETVNRHIIEAKNIIGKTLKVNLSAFPFKLSVYENIEEWNNQSGFGNKVQVGDTDMVVSGYSDHFIAPGYMFKNDPDSDETFSFVIGTITGLRNVCIEISRKKYDLIIAEIDTAAGNLTTLINKERYDVENISVGKLAVMMADIKANFKPGDSA